MRRAYTAKKLGNWESFKEECGKEGQLCEWTIERLQEACDKVAMDDIGRLSTAQEISRKSTDFLRRSIAPAGGMGGVILSYVCPHCRCFPLDDYILWVSTGHGDGNNSKKKHCNWWCAACGGQYEWRVPNMILVQTERKSSTRLVSALKLLANPQEDGGSPIQSIATGLHERSRKGIMNGPRRLIEADTDSAVDVGDLRRDTISVDVKKPQFSEAFPEAVIREGADELTLRADEVATQRAFINTKHIEFERWRPPLVDNLQRN